MKEVIATAQATNTSGMTRFMRSNVKEISHGRVSWQTH